MKRIILKTAVLWLMALTPVWTWGQANVPHHYSSVHYKMGPVNGKTLQELSADLKNPGTVSTKDYITSSLIINEANAAWIELYFEDVILSKTSYMIIRSLEDGGDQVLNAKTLGAWQNHSAMFNGDAVEIILYAAPGDLNVGFAVNKIVVGEYISQIRDTCGSDNRVISYADAIGRLMPVGCTGWIIPNGAYLTAGHCADYDGNGTVEQPIDILEFNVPLSDPSGSTNASDPDDQYAVIYSSIVYQRTTDPDLGDDWTIFDVSPNSNTGLLPNEAQGSFGVYDVTFHRVTHDLNPATLRVTGYGVDHDEYNQIQQTQSGPNNGENIVDANTSFYDYTVDTDGGNSGSPIIKNGTHTAVGIHTNGGCTPAGGNNHGTSFEEDDLEAAIDSYLGSDYVYVDKDHPSSSETGTMFHPEKTIANGVADASDGDVIAIVEGGYAESITISKEVTLKAPVGMVVIGPGASLKPAGSSLAETASQETNFTAPVQDFVSTDFEFIIYPNPVRDLINLHFTLDNHERVSLRIRDVLANEVKAVFLDKDFDKGIHNFSFDCSSLNAGVYFAELETSDGKIIRKLVKD